MMKCLACNYQNENFTILQVAVPELSKSYDVAFCPECGLGETLHVDAEDVQRLNELRYGDVEGRLKVYYTELFHHLQVRYLESLRIIERWKKGNRLLEVGSNVGFTLNIARRKGYDAYGCEINASIRRISEALYGIPVEQDFFAMTRSFDVIIMNDVLEHFPDPGLALNQAYRLLDTGGTLFVQLPNAGSSRFKRLQERWEFLMPPDHTFHFTVKSLQMLALKNRLEYVWHRTVNSIEDFRAFQLFPSRLRENILYVLHHNPWYWPRFYPGKNDKGSLIQMILAKR